MKKVSKVILSSIILSSAFLASCDKEITTSPLTIDQSQKGTVQAIVYADLDLTNYGKELVPAGTRVILTIPYSDLGSSATGNWIDTLTTNAQGQISALVPTNAKGVTVTLTPIDFIADQTQPLGSHYAKISKLFQKTGAATTLTVKTADVKIALLEYNTISSLSDFDNLVTIQGKAFAELDNNSAGEENAPLIDVIFAGTGFSTKVTLTQNVTNTIFTVNVPNNLAITYSYDFIAQKNISDGAGGWKRVSFRYKGTNTLGTYTADTDGLSLDFGIGVQVN
jgi:hypothetical protein